MKSRSILLLLTIGLLTAGCGDSGDGAPAAVDAGPQSDAGLRTIDLLGTWVATSHVYTDNANSDQSYDIIAEGGETRMTVLAGGRVRTFVTIGADEDQFDGLLEVVGEVLRLTTDQDPPKVFNWSFVYTGDTLTLEDANQSFDFTLSGATEVSATERIVYALN